MCFIIQNLIYLLIIINLIQANRECDNIVSITDFVSTNCNNTNNEYYFESIHKDFCIPGCLKKSGIGESCKTIDCAPGLKCDDENLNFNCIMNDNPMCFQWYHKDTKWKPDCLLDGYFAPKQCKGESLNGRCFCYDKYGKRIFGEAWSNKAENMTCACSRHRAELEENNRTDVTLHCDSMGNYEPLQCESGVCWCADSKTGQVLETVVSEEMMNTLTCYDKAKVGDQYLRKCESQAIAIAKIKLEFDTHGTSAYIPSIMCDYDGSYGRYRIDKKIIYCIWRDGTNTGFFSENINNMNCNCARDSKIYALEGKEFNKVCESSGNYQILQINGNKMNYCVDSDGFITLGPQENLQVNDCPTEFA